jgi:hypothetical protein
LDLTAAEKHYDFLKHNKYTEIRIFGTSEKIQLSYEVSTRDDFLSLIKDKPTYNLGVGIHEREQGGKEDTHVMCVRYIPIDLDSKNPETIKQTEQKLSEVGLRWGAKIFSGQKGYHYYIPIKPIKEKDDLTQVLKNARHYLVDTLGLPIDSKCFNPSRIFRIWGSENKGSEVKIEFLDNTIPEVDALEAFPKYSEDSEAVRISADKHYTKQCLEDYPLFEALYKNPKIFPDKENTQFNDIILKNIAAYAYAKEQKDLRPWELLCTQKGHAVDEFYGWYRKASNIKFNPFEVHNNIRKHYPDTLYKEFVLPSMMTSTHKITYVDDDTSQWYELKKQYKRTNSFPVNKQFRTEGSALLLQPHKEKLLLARLYQSMSDPNVYHKIYFDDENSKKKMSKKQMDELDLQPCPDIEGSFYVYDVRTTSQNKVRMFSEEKIDNGRYEFYGSLISVKDLYNIGTKSYISTNQMMLILNSYKTKQMKYQTLEQLKRDCNFTADEYYDYMLTEFDETDDPILYKTLPFYKLVYTTFLFSGHGRNNELLHIIIFGPSGSGKSPQLRAISEKFMERKPYISGTDATMAGLKISYWENPPKLGALLEANRICAIDEIFKLFNRLDDPSQITDLNQYLDNATITGVSGKMDANLKATAQIFGATNPLSVKERMSGSVHRMSLREMFTYVPADFWGRFLTIKQTLKDRDWVKYGEADGTSCVENPPLNKDITREHVIAIYDFFKDLKLKSKYDNQRIVKIAHSVSVPDDMSEIYSKVCNKIPRLVFDGMIKWKIFSENRAEDRCVVENDYMDFEIFWKEIIERWFEGEGISDPLSFLGRRELDIFEIIRTKKVLSNKDLDDECVKLNVDKKVMIEKFERLALIIATEDEVKYNDVLDDIE